MLDLPEPLYESVADGTMICLVCARRRATSALWAGNRSIVPICVDCSADWNMYGYLALRKIKPASLVTGILKYKLTHPWQEPSIARVWQTIGAFKEWARKMKKFARS
jgi:hypothetical protein